MNMIFFIQVEFKDTHNFLNALDAEQLAPDEQFYHQLFKMRNIIMHLGCLIKTWGSSQGRVLPSDVYWKGLNAFSGLRNENSSQDFF